MTKTGFFATCVLAESAGVQVLRWPACPFYLSRSP